MNKHKPYSYHPEFSSFPGSRIYAWGSGEQKNCIPNAEVHKDKQGHIPFPLALRLSDVGKEINGKPSSSGRKYIQICADTGNVFCILDERGKAIVWGNPRFGFPEFPLQQGKDVNDQGHSSFSPKFNLLAVGDRFVVGITRDWKLMGWNLVDFRKHEHHARKKNHHKISNQTDTESNFSLVPEMIGKKVIDIAACGNFALLVAEEQSTHTGEESKVTKSQRRLYMRYTGATSSKVGAAYIPYSQVFTIVKELSHCNIRLISVGSTVRACVDESNRLYTWGSNRNGALGHGKRSKQEVNVPTMVQLCPGLLSTSIVSIDCTRGQPNPKNQFADPTGQEGPRIHLVTADGGLWIAGTCHKGLGADHLGKVMTSSGDHLNFYRVGGTAREFANEDSNINLSAKQKSVLKGLCLTGCLDSVPVDESVNYFVHKNTHSITEATRKSLLACGIKITQQNHPSPPFAHDAKKNQHHLLNATNESGIMTNYLTDTPIMKSASAHIHSFALSTSGELFGWGCGSNGRLGVPYFFKRDGSKRLMKCYVSTPSRVGLDASKLSLKKESKRTSGFVKVASKEKSFQDEKVLAISVGRYWSFAIVL